MSARRALRPWRWLAQLRPTRRIAGALVRRADAVRDRGGHEAAAILYEEALELVPGRADLHVQSGHMRKESGDLASALSHYLAAQALMPDNADLALQLGHFYKVARRNEAALDAYRRALAMRPGWADAIREIEGLSRAEPEPVATETELVGAERLAPEIAPAVRPDRSFAAIDTIEMCQLGLMLGRDGGRRLQTLSGVEALRGVCTSRAPVAAIEILLDGETVHRRSLEVADADEAAHEFSFNEWVDFSLSEPGRHEIELRCRCADDTIIAHRQIVLVAPAVPADAHPDSDAVIALPPETAGSVEQRINALPSVVRPARRALFPDGIRNVLVVRADQLGDMVCSIPALRRLRELLPQANMVGLLSEANAEFAATLDLFDETVVIEFPDDPGERKRVLSFEEQAGLRATLHRWQFDLAIDLAESGASRPLLLLSGARFLYGFHDNQWPWLSAGLVANVPDPRNRHEIATPSSKILSLVERLGTLVRTGAEIIRRPELDRGLLHRFGIAEGERYAVLHGGARLAFTRWPHYPALAERLVREAALKVVLLTEDVLDPGDLPAGLADDPRFRLVEGRLPFDELDALLSYCDIFVGNDSGPKHLAALRGVPVVSIHSARVNWNEWGQELTGKIISRRVPCAGCGIAYDASHCGKDIACVRRITVDEVFAAARELLAPAGSDHADGPSCGADYR